jgi:hypothetical protein
MVGRMLRYVGKAKTIVFEATKDTKIDLLKMLMF